jgi:hypothetical protein
MRDAEAVRLFCERSSAVRPDFVLDESVVDDVARICRTLDGLPLAIELAAARTNVLSVASILVRLGDRFALLRKVGRAAEVRQRSLRGAIEWSYELLDNDQRLFFDRLGVFAGRFTLDAAGAVAAHELGTDLLEPLSAVVDRSLVVADSDDSYRMLDSLRAYAAVRLNLNPAEWNATHARLAARLIDHCEVADARLRGARQAATLEPPRHLGLIGHGPLEVEWSLANVLPNRPIIRTSATLSHTRPRAPSFDAWDTVDQSSPNPAQKALPSARRRTTRTSSSRSAASRAASSSLRNASVIVLNSSGRPSTKWRTAPSSSTGMASPIRHVSLVVSTTARRDVDPGRAEPVAEVRHAPRAVRYSRHRRHGGTRRRHRRSRAVDTPQLRRPNGDARHPGRRGCDDCVEGYGRPHADVRATCRGGMRGDGGRAGGRMFV